MSFGWNPLCIKAVSQPDCEDLFNYPAWQLSDAVIGGLLTSLRFHLPAVVKMYKQCGGDKFLSLSESNIRLTDPKAFNAPCVIIEFAECRYKTNRNQCEATYNMTADIVLPMESASDCLKVDLQNYANAFVRVITHLNEAQLWKFEDCHKRVGIRLDNEIVVRKIPEGNNALRVNFTISASELSQTKI